MEENRKFEYVLSMTYKMITEGKLTTIISGKKIKYLTQRIGNIYYPIVNNALRQQYEKCKDIEEIVDLAFNFQFLGVNIRPLQVRDEIISLLEILIKNKPMNVLEIGTAGGGTLFLFAGVASSNAIIISVDLPQELINYGIDPKSNARILKRFAKDKQKINLIWADSHNFDTVRQIREILGPSKVDFLFLDGDHSYDGVKKDFEMYSPLVRHGGIVALHDIVDHPPETRCEVGKFWRELKASYEYMEIVHDCNQKWAGIGVLFI
jgi:cephalosporin hydroxylase